MKKRIGTLLKKIRSNRRSYVQRVKKLRLEGLEARQLLAADLGVNTDPLAYHNSINPNDVNRDSIISPVDAILIVNHLNNNEDATLPAVDGLAKTSLLDTNADGFVTPHDALNVINSLNAEGETTPTAIFTHELTDLEGNPLPLVGGRPTVAVGQLFQLNTSIQDNRPIFTAEGILSAYLDINFDNVDAFDVAGGEIQSFSYFTDQLDLTSSDNTFQLTFDGQTTSPINILQQRDSVANSIQTALEGLSNVGTGNVTVVVDAAARSDDEANGIARETYEIRFGRNLLNQDLPLIAIDATGIDVVTDGTFVRNLVEVVPGGAQTGERQSLEFFIDQLDTTAASSSFTLTLEGQTTGPISLTNGGALLSETDMAAAIEAALEGLALVRPEDVIVSLNPAQTDTDRYSFFVDFSDRFAGIDLAQMTLDSTNVVLSSATSTFVSTIAEVTPGDSNSSRSIAFAELYNIARRGEVTLAGFNDIGATTRPPVTGPADVKALFSIPLVATAPGTINFMPTEGGNPPSTDILTRMNSEIVEVPVSMVDFGANFVLDVIEDPTAPVAVNDMVSTNEDTALTLGANILANDQANDATREPLSIVSISTVAGTTVGSLSGTTYTPPADFNGTDILTYVIQDNTGLTSNTGTITITVDPVNDAPIAVNDAPSVDEDSTNNTLDLLANDSAGPANETEAIIIVALGATSNGGVATINAGGGSVNYTPAAGFIGTDTFTYTIEDAGGLQSTATVNVDVAPAVVPSARPDSDVTDEGSPVTINVLNNDRVNAGAAATLISAADGANGTVQILDNGTPSDLTDDTVQYTPNADFNGTDTFTYVMNDTAGIGVDSTGTVTITVNNINDAPVLADDTASGTEDTPVTIAISTLLANDSPGPGEGAGTQNPQTLTLTSVAPSSSVQIVGDNVVFTPATDANGVFEFTYTATDSDVNNPLSATATVTVTIAAVNDDPIAVADTESTSEDNALTIADSALIGNDLPGPPTATDETDQTLSLTSVSSTSTAGGTVSLSGGNVTYTPAADFNGSDTFTYVVTDSEGGSATGTVTINVSPVNDAPILVADAQQTAFKDFPKTIPFSDILGNDQPGPANESDQTLTIVSASATNGTVVINTTDQTLTYTPSAGYTGPDTISYTVQDSGSGTAPNVNQASSTLSLQVEEFLPSNISGTVWIDENNDGLMNTFERGLGAVTVTLTGTSLGQSVPAQSQITLLDGTYSFDNLGPGSYVISFGTASYLPDGHDVPGTLGDADGISNNNQFAINLAEPGGFAASGYDFAVMGLEHHTVNEINRKAAPYIVKDTSLAINGAYFAIASDNSLLWSTKLSGFDGFAFGEAVLEGNDLLLTVVDMNQNVSTAVLTEGDFVHVSGADGSTLVRVLGDAGRFNWTPVDLSTPPFSTAGYLDAIDEIFAQEGW